MQWPAQSCSLHDRPFMSQAGRKRYFAWSAARARGARRGKEKNKALFLFLFLSSSSRLALRARVALRANYRVRPAWLIKRLSCRLQSCDVRAAKGRFRCNTVEYKTDFLWSDYLYFLWHGINENIGFWLTKCSRHQVSITNSSDGHYGPPTSHGYALEHSPLAPTFTVVSRATKQKSSNYVKKKHRPKIANARSNSFSKHFHCWNVPGEFHNPENSGQTKHAQNVQRSTERWRGNKQGDVKWHNCDQIDDV